MSGERKAKKKLSSAILEMKFMKRSREAEMAEQEAEVGRAMFASEVTEAMKLGGSWYILEPSFVPCENLGPARLSFHGMNPEIERLQAGRPEEPTIPEEEDAEIPAQEMAVALNMANKFKRSSRGLLPPKKKARFMKPSDD